MPFSRWRFCCPRPTRENEQLSCGQPNPNKTARYKGKVEFRTVCISNHCGVPHDSVVCFLVILGKSHYVLFNLVSAMQPRMLVTFDTELRPLPVSVRVGQVSYLGKTSDNKDLNQITEPSGFRENMGLMGVHILAGSQTWFQSLLFKDIRYVAERLSSHNPYFTLWDDQIV